jgi:flavin-dependent dehydrogenase
MRRAAGRCDVVVVGGGPAGSSVAGLLALEGLDVALLEREKAPRYHIGESLISGVLPTLTALGLRERMELMGFQRKYGAELLWGLDEPISFRFREVRDARFEYSYQVRRADFDAMLLDRARELGVHVMEGAEVKDAIFDGPRMTGVHYRMRGEDRGRDLHATIIVDASGQQRWLGRRFNLVSWHEDLRNIAAWSYYAGGLRHEGEFEGDLFAELRPQGWLWYLPLSRDITGIGFVTPSARMAEAGLPPGQVLEQQIAESTEVARLTEHAERVDIYRTARDWSYACTRFSGPGWVLVGDAAAFIDPLLSTGVTLAMRGAARLRRAVLESLVDPAKERDVMHAYEQNYREFLDALLELVRFFYDGGKNRDDFDLRSQAIIDPDRRLPARLSFVRLMSGLVRGDEQLDLLD